MAKKIKKASELTSAELCQIAINGMQERKAQNIVLMDLRHVKNAFTDFFVIGSGTSDTQIDAIADSVDEEIFKATGQNPTYKEGKTNREWILLDYIDIVVHIFKKEKRDFFKLEELWGDAEFEYYE